MKKRVIFLCVTAALILTLSLTALAADPIFIYASEGKNKGMVLTDSGESYSGKYVSGDTDETYIDYTFNIAEAGDYIIWARVWASGDANNSLLYHMGGKASPNSVTFADNINTFDMRDALWGEQDVLNPNRPSWDNFYDPDIHNSEDWYGVWYWMPICYRGVSDEISFYKYTTDRFSLGAGDHTLTIYTRISEPDARFDMFIVTNDLSYDPSKAGGDPKTAWLAAHPAAAEEPEPAAEEAPAEPAAVPEPAAPAPEPAPPAPQTGDPFLIFQVTALLAAGTAYLARKKQK
ncbi:MAG: hypothetical protein FWD23_17945 [Oscillospiraceae bacterium]|nr:hypothetical protein [Oscillospiraceae bacterium]